MQTSFNFISKGMGRLVEHPVIYLVGIGINPYILFVFMAIIIFLFYFLIFYKGRYSLFLSHFERMSSKQKKNWLIFLVGGFLIAFILFYQMLHFFYNQADLNKYRSSKIDMAAASFGERMTIFLEKVGIAK